MRSIAILAFASAFLFAGGTVVGAASKSELKQRFEQRNAELSRLKQAGQVGETYLGYVEAVKAEHARDPAASRAIADENRDRAELYGLIAQEQGTTVAKVAETAARSNFRFARSGEWLKYPEGWRRRT